VVGAVWAITQLASVFFNRPVDPAVHGIMFVCVSGLLGIAWKAGKVAEQNGNGKSSDA